MTVESGQDTVGADEALTLRGLPGWVVILLLLIARASLADDKTRDPIAEPLIAESITDIDGDEKGEAEVDLTAIGARRLDASNFGSGEAELEVKLTRRLGVNLAIELNGDDARAVAVVGLRVGASFGLLHDYRRELHLSLEATALAFGSEFAILKNDEGGAPYTVGFRAAHRLAGWLTTRLGFGLALGGAKPVPLFASVAALGEWGRRGRRSFAGLEVVSDWSSRSPLILAPEVAVGFLVGDLQPRIGLALPITVGYRREDFAVGALIRFMFEIEQD